MDFFKALIPGVILTFVVSMVMGAGHSTGGWLNVRHFYILEHNFYWSWLMFVIATGLAWMLYIIIPK